MTRGIGLPHVLQDDAHRLQDVVAHARNMGDPRELRHAKIHQKLGDIAHKDRQPPDLGDVLHLDILKESSELNELHQLFTIIPGLIP
jgi:hypothetical protein